LFAEEVNIDIGAPLYARNGSSKGKRLRCLLQTVDKPTAVRTLKALWEYREALRQREPTKCSAARARRGRSSR